MSWKRGKRPKSISSWKHYYLWQVFPSKRIFRLIFPAFEIGRSLTSVITLGGKKGFFSSFLLDLYVLKETGFQYSFKPSRFTHIGGGNFLRIANPNHKITCQEQKWEGKEEVKRWKEFQKGKIEIVKKGKKCALFSAMIYSRWRKRAESAALYYKWRCGRTFSSSLFNIITSRS